MFHRKLIKCANSSIFLAIAELLRLSGAYFPCNDQTKNIQSATNNNTKQITYELYMNCFCITNNPTSIIANFTEEKRGIYSSIIVLS